MEENHKDTKIESDWVPCTQQLPNMATEVLVTVECKDGQRMVTLGYYAPSIKIWRLTSFYDLGSKVVAWMPRPKAYEVG